MFKQSAQNVEASVRKGGDFLPVVGAVVTVGAGVVTATTIKRDHKHFQMAFVVL